MAILVQLVEDRARNVIVRRRPAPTYRCQIHDTHTVLSLDGGLTQTGWCGMFVYVPWFDRDVSWCCKAKPRPCLYTGSVQFGAADGGSDEAQMTRIQQCSHKSRVPQ